MAPMRANSACPSPPSPQLARYFQTGARQICDCRRRLAELLGNVGSTGLAGLSRLSVWWIRLGIQLQRIDPGHPEQNGRHERMHRTLKAETATPPERNLRAQQRAFDRFRQIYNQERPHESLASNARYQVVEAAERLPELEYPRMLPRRCARIGLLVSCFSANAGGRDGRNEAAGLGLAGRFPRDESRGYDCFGWPAPAPHVGVRSDKRLTIAVTPFAHIYVAHPFQTFQLALRCQLK